MADEESAFPAIASGIDPSMAVLSTPNASEATPTDQVNDPDAQNMLIDSLRSQIQDLYSQVTQLNMKLVKSYDRVSDLEDGLHVASASLRTSSLKISQLELERTQHLAALNTGLLVETSHVAAELTRLMEKVAEESAQRGQAESARANIEKELDDLSASLFQQANTMVAEARLARALSERKVEEAEAALKDAEEAVRGMQQQMQVLESEKEAAERSADTFRALIGKDAFVERTSSNTALPKPIKLLSSHLPYQEFLLFVAHLRAIHPSSPHPPAMSTLLPLPFLARLLAEDTEPTIRLDIAPSLNWLSRRSVLSALYSGQLTIEPVSASTLFDPISSTTATPLISGTTTSSATVSCALCGTSIFPLSDKSRTPSRSNSNGTNGMSSWSASLFRNPLNYSQSGTAYESPPPTPPRSAARTPVPQLPSTSQQIHIFRISSPMTPMAASLGITLPSALPLSSASPSMSSYPSPHFTQSQDKNRSSASSSTLYPLCTSGWCLTRLRSTGTLWAFVRTSIIERVWEEEIVVLPSPPQREPDQETGAPPLPPRRRGLWGMASALSERAASWGEGDKAAKEKAKKISPQQPPSSTPSSRPSSTRSSPSSSAPLPLPIPTRVDSHDRMLTGPIPPNIQDVQSSLLEEGEAPKENGSTQDVPPSEAAVQPLRVAVDATAPAPLLSPTSSPTKSKISRKPPPAYHLDPVSSEEIVTVATSETTMAMGEENSRRESSSTSSAEPVRRLSAGSKAETDPQPSDTAVLPDSKSTTPKGLQSTSHSASEDLGTTAPRVVPPPLTLDAESTSSNNLKPVAAAPPPLPQRAAARAVAGRTSQPRAPDPVTEVPTSDAYVGDMTWEERTWKELVRLKENMFLARVGGER